MIKESYHSNTFLNYFLFGFTKFLNGILSSIFEKAKYFCRKNVSTEEFWQFCRIMTLHMKFLKWFHKHLQITIVATTFTNINMNRWKWVLLPCLLVNVQAAIYRNLLLARCRAFEHVELTTMYLTNLQFHLHFRELPLLQKILLIKTMALLLKALE